MSPYRIAYLRLTKNLKQLQKKFIAQFLPANPTTLPIQYQLDVQAYCLLAHAAIEEYVEQVALALADETITSWSKGARPNRTLVSLVAFYDEESSIEDDKVLTTTKCFDRIRHLLKSLHKKYSQDVQDNHGVSVKYLRRILYPVAIDISDDPKLQNSLRTLALERGSYAHKSTIKKVLSPEDAATCVQDCQTICLDIATQAIALAKTCK